MGAVLTGMVGSEDLRVDSPEAQGLCPAEEGRGRDAAATDKVAAIDELPARLRARWGACYACGMGVGGMVLVELSSTLSDVARSMGTTAPKSPVHAQPSQASTARRGTGEHARRLKNEKLP